MDGSLEVTQMGASLATTARLAEEAATGRYNMLVSAQQLGTRVQGGSCNECMG